ncbi:MAG: hypothetical protein KGJ93_04655, partial [Patescibacteria group bacterium]|nr:hypothetical protein [Patescibacteria group bacterium]
NFTFAYTSANNGSYQVPVPTLNLQSGYYYSSGDRHYFAVRPDTCDITEIYNSGANSPGFDIFPKSSSGLRYNAMTGALASYYHGGTNAAGMFMIPNSLRTQEVMKALATGAGVVPHPINITLHNYTQLGGGPEWPATAIAVNASGVIPYGARFRLKSSYTYTGSNPVTAILINTMKQYGFIVSDGGYSLDTYGLDADNAPPQMQSALKEILGYGVNFMNNFEFVKESDLAPSVTTDAAGGLVDPSKAAAISGFVMPQFAQVNVTDTSGATSTMRVLLKGATVDFEKSLYAFMAGASAFQLPYHISGLSDASVTCSMSPALGTLDAATCTYTPPATISSPTMTTVIVTSNAQPSVKTETQVVVLPGGTLNLLPANPGNFTDSHGQQWWTVSPNTGFPVAEFGGTLTALYQDAPTSLTDWQLYGYGYHPRGDIGIDLQVPPGDYQITVKALSTSSHSWEHLESQGAVIYPNFDTYNIAGGTANVPADFLMPAVVGADGHLSIYARRRDGYGNPPVFGADTATKLTAVSIQAAADTTPHISITPSVAPVSVTPGQTQQFTCIGWYMSNSCSWAVSSGPGTINSSGLYTAPSTPPSADTAVTITATSLADGTKTATASLTLTFGSITVSPAKTTTDRELTTNFSGAINGVSYGNVTWSISPSVGSINPTTGVYTAPHTLSATTTVTVIATSNDNPSNTGATTITIRPEPLPIYLAPGLGYPTNLTDSSGIYWTPGLQYFSCTGGQCYPNSNGGALVDTSLTLPGSSTILPPVEEVSATTLRIWQGVQRGSVYAPPPQTDFTYTFPLPNGSYQLALAFNSGKGLSDPTDQSHNGQNIYVNGTKWLSDFNLVRDCGGTNLACSPAPLTVSVTNNKLAVMFESNYAPHLNNPSNTYVTPGVNLIRVLPLPSAGVSLASPADGQSIGSTAILSAVFSGSATVAGVTFYLDGTTPIGSEVTAASSPNTYSLNWNSSAAAEGSHTLTAVVRDTSGGYATSSPVSITIDRTAPTIPTGLNGTAAAPTEVGLWWTAATDNIGVAGYHVYRGGTRIATTTTTSYSDTALAADTSYSYTVSAFDAAGNESPVTTAISVTTQTANNTSKNYVAPSNVITNFAARAGDSQAALTWVNPNTDSGWVKTEIVRLTGAVSAPDLSSGTKVYEGTNQFFVDTGLKNGITYNYAAFAIDQKGNAATPVTTSVTPTSTPNTPHQTTPAATSGTYLINDHGTIYLVQGGVRHGVTDPGILFSYGFDLKAASAATDADLTLPQGQLLTPGDGSLVKSKADPTVYLISGGQRYAFTSSAVFSALGFKWSSVQTVTNPEMQALPKASLLNDGSAAHLPGLDVNDHGTIYWIAGDFSRQAYPSLDVYNSWHRSGDFSWVVPANQADQALVVKGMVTPRVLGR